MDYKKIIWLVLGLACLPAAVVNGQTLTRGPYLQLGDTDAITVRWRTDAATNSVVRYGTSEGNLSQVANDGTVTKEHEVRLTGLSANTKYYYAVGSSAATLASGADCFFVTAPTGTKPTRVWLLGDPGTGNEDAKAVRDAYYKFTGTRHTDLWMMNGDNAYNNGTDAEYTSKLFRIYGSMLKKSVLWSAYGNHDAASSDAATQTGPYFVQHTFPRNAESGGVASGTEAYYSFNYSNIHFVMLDSSESSRQVGSPQLLWLERDLAANKKEWVVVVVHHPPYTRGEEHSDKLYIMKQVRENMGPILEKHGVDLVIGGHAHCYQRSALVNGHYGLSTTFDRASMVVQGGNGRIDGNGAYIKDMTDKAFSGTVYLVAGASGKVGGNAVNHPVMHTSMSVLGSVVMDFNGGQLDVLYLDRAGARRDYFTIKKKGTSTNPTPDPEPEPEPANKAPAVSLTSPAPSSAYTTPASITIQAAASDVDGSVSKVEFFGAGQSLGADATSPYSLVWSNAPEGAQTITARATDNDGATSTSSPVLVNVTKPVTTPTAAVTSFTLINADTDLPVPGYEWIPNGTVLVRGALPTNNLSVRVNTTPAQVGSVRIGWNTTANFRTETDAPYSLFGGPVNNYYGGTIPNGAHTFTATPFSLSGGQGVAGQSLTISFSIVDQPPPVGDRVTSFTLINADTNAPIPGYENIANGAVISRAALPTTRLSLRVNTSPAKVGSVRIGWNGTSNFRTESDAPYALFGGPVGDYYAGTIANGTHTFTGTPYSEAGGQGTAGNGLSVTFKIQ